MYGTSYVSDASGIVALFLIESEENWLYNRIIGEKLPYILSSEGQYNTKCCLYNEYSINSGCPEAFLIQYS